MRSPSSLKQEFIKKWVMGLQVCSASKKKMSILERKKAIKLSADVAMASARNASTCWSRALLAKASKDNENKILIDHLLGTKSDKIKKAPIASLRHKKILKKRRSLRRSVKKIPPQKAPASSIARRLVKKRTQVLKRLVPGGESMDELSLIEETLDYIVSLRAQVDVMRRLANATEHLNRK